jgi:lysozyme family protein
MKVIADENIPKYVCGILHKKKSSVNYFLMIPTDNLKI